MREAALPFDGPEDVADAAEPIIQRFPAVAYFTSPELAPEHILWGGFLSYGLLNLVIIGVGIGLVLLGARLRTRREAKSRVLDPALTTQAQDPARGQAAGPATQSFRSPDRRVERQGDRPTLAALVRAGAAAASAPRPAQPHRAAVGA